MTRVADTSALYALVNKRDVHHEEARKAILDKTPIEIPPVILVETVDLVAYRHGFQVAHEAATVLLEFPHVGVAEGVRMEAVFQIHQDARGGLSMADAVVVQTCRVLGGDPWTYDDRIIKWCGQRAP